MVSRRERMALRKLESLRSTRLRLAEINTAKAVSAHAEALRLEERTREDLARTAAFCESENKRLAAELSNFVKEGKDGIAQWKRERMKLRERYNQAQQELEQAREICREREKELAARRAEQRAATLAVEKLSILMSKI